MAKPYNKKTERKGFCIPLAIIQQIRKLEIQKELTLKEDKLRTSSQNQNIQPSGESENWTT